jgi:transposase
MRKRDFHLTEHEIEAFRRAAQQTRDVHALKRLQAVRLYGSGLAMRDILQVVGCGQSSVLQWAQVYRREGLGGLRSKWKGGNANKLTVAQRHEVRQRLLSDRPVDWQLSQGQFWTVSDLKVAVQRWYGVTYQSDDSYLNLLHACGFSYQRAERRYRSRPSEAVIAEFEAELEKK